MNYFPPSPESLIGWPSLRDLSQAILINLPACPDRDQDQVSAQDRVPVRERPPHRPAAAVFCVVSLIAFCCVIIP